jgi:hypothetical protein
VGGSGHWSLPDAGGGVSGDISFWGDDFGRNVLWAIPDVPVQEEWMHLGLGLAVSAITAYFAVKWLLGYVRTNTLIPFAWYRIGMGLVWLWMVK